MYERARRQKHNIASVATSNRYIFRAKNSIVQFLLLREVFSKPRHQRPQVAKKKYTYIRVAKMLNAEGEQFLHSAMH